MKQWVHSQGTYSGRPSNSVLGDKLREKMEGGKRDEAFFSALNVHTPIQIVFLNNFANCRSPFKNESCDVQTFDNQMNAVVGAHMKKCRNKRQTTARQS